MHHKTIAQISQDLHNKQYSSKELTRYLLDRIKTYNTDLNSFITITEEHALKAAEQADQAFNQNKTHRLTGIPIAHKDIFCTLGIKTSCGSKILDNFIAPYNATVITKFQE